MRIPDEQLPTQWSRPALWTGVVTLGSLCLALVAHAALLDPSVPAQVVLPTPGVSPPAHSPTAFSALFAALALLVSVLVAGLLFVKWRERRDKRRLRRRALRLVPLP